MTFIENAAHTVTKLVPIGSVVRYHGSMTNFHGTYRITRNGFPTADRPYGMEPVSPDLAERLGGRELQFVSPASFTVIVRKEA